MNIFVLSTDPFEAAKMQCDKHVVRMSLETAQILSTVMHLKGEENPPYRPTHVNHPCVKWPLEHANRWWLWFHFCGLLDEYTMRYRRIHACARLKDSLRPPRTHEMVPCEHDKFVQCMPVQYKVSGDAVEAYRRFYAGEKSRFARWRHSDEPTWWKSYVDEAKGNNT